MYIYEWCEKMLFGGVSCHLCRTLSLRSLFFWVSGVYMLHFIVVFCVKLFLFFLVCVIIKCDLCRHIRKSVL